MRLIAGSGRSGTTWVQDALAAANDLRPVFEPLHPAVSDIGARYAHRALSPDDEYPELERFLNEVCAGGRHAMWIKFRGRPDRLFPTIKDLGTIDSAKLLYHRWRKFLTDMPALAAAGRKPNPLVKCIRANLMLGWLARRLNCKIVLIVRHPGAVVESQLRRGDTWDPEPVVNRFRSDALLHHLTGNRYRALLERQLSYVEALCVNWVIENQWALEQAPANGVTVTFYEHLKSFPDREWRRVCQALELPNIPGATIHERPSQQSSTGRPDVTGKSSGEPRWLRRLSRQQAGQIQDVLDQANFALYAMSDPEPRDTIGNSVSNRPTRLTQ